MEDCDAQQEGKLWGWVGVIFGPVQFVVDILSPFARAAAMRFKASSTNLYSNLFIRRFILSFTRVSWWRGTVVERRSLAGELSLSCARPAADG